MKNINIKNLINWILISLLMAVIGGLTIFVKTPQELTEWLSDVVLETKTFSAIVHVLFLIVLVIGLIFKKVRNLLFFLFMAFISLSATIISIKYAIVPNVIIFAIFFALIVHAYFTKKLNFDFKNLSFSAIFFGIIGLLLGFWYLHWVESPVFLNALLYSPLGVVNCPTMVTICGFLCLTDKPRHSTLEIIVALITLYFGFFGIFRLGAYVDVALIVCSLFLIFRYQIKTND
ncbi:MAG: hypothetical protein K8S16_11415 [Bacteroidales bacterium]|nr:hypothetical protein [Bacteroidales bacterium]